VKHEQGEFIEAS